MGILNLASDGTMPVLWVVYRYLEKAPNKSAKRTDLESLLKPRGDRTDDAKLRQCLNKWTS